MAIWALWAAAHLSSLKMMQHRGDCDDTNLNIEPPGQRIVTRRISAAIR